MAEKNFDLVVVGGGSAGYTAALRARQLGSSVALIERSLLGGTCLHRGCIPTKALVHVSEVTKEVRSAGKLGVLGRYDGIDTTAVNRFKDDIVGGKFKGLQGLLKAKGVEHVVGDGRLVGPRSVQVGDDVYQAKNVVLATGSEPKLLPGITPEGRVITSDIALQLTGMPRSVIVLGGGVIGVEFASIWNYFGVEVTIVEALPHLVPNEEEVLSRQLERMFKRRGIQAFLGARVNGVTQDENQVTVALDGGQSLSADLLLVAVGRQPVTDGLGLEEQGVNTDRGYVLVNERLATNVPGLWAVGDITPGLQLAHRAYQQGIFVAEEIAGLRPRVVEDVYIPRVTYSDPEVASVGYTEKAAIEKFGADRVESKEYNLAGNAKSSILETGGLVKGVRLKGGPVVGLHLVGSRVSELIGEAQLIVGWEAYPEDVAPLIHAHPTQGEAIGEVMLALAGKPLHAV